LFSQNKYKNAGIFFLIVLIITVADQWTKNWAWELFLTKNETIIPVYDGWFNLKMARNPGVAWSVLSDYPFELTIMTSLISIALCFYALYSSTTKLVLFSWALVVGGALGNIVDRFEGVIKSYEQYGKIENHMIFVRDFLDVYWNNSHWPTFNLADSVICMGVAYLFFYSFFIEGKEEAAKDEPEQEKNSELADKALVESDIGDSEQD